MGYFAQVRGHANASNGNEVIVDVAYQFQTPQNTSEQLRTEEGAKRRRPAPCTVGTMRRRCWPSECRARAAAPVMLVHRTYQWHDGEQNFTWQ